MIATAFLEQCLVYCSKASRSCLDRNLPDVIGFIMLHAPIADRGVFGLDEMDPFDVFCGLTIGDELAAVGDDASILADLEKKMYYLTIYLLFSSQFDQMYNEHNANSFERERKKGTKVERNGNRISRREDMR